MPLKTAAITVHSVYTMQPCTVSHHFMQSHILTVHACLAVTNHLHFGKNDWDSAKQEGNGYRNKSQHRKLTLEKKILMPLLLGLEPTIFQSGTLTTELSPLVLSSCLN